MPNSSSTRDWLIGGAIVVGLIWYANSDDDSEPEPYTPTPQFQTDLTPTVDGDLDCVDVGREIYVGMNDPNGLDADGDGWGCEGW